ncbi:glycosyltransferase family 4 protein [Flavobacterium sp. KJJ]|uniref:glycosyltransferase family 4 protein n=1 Tax=Flavobacterium sp. KJJ TaxID=1270193 RepID=UPI000493A433|nr:glycosyltransferase [Flavobacterium sp. KJJ]
MKILLISHDASLTGAPILLLNLAGLLLKNNEDIVFLLKEGGVLESDFALMAPTYNLKEDKKSLWNILNTKKSIIDDKNFLKQFDVIISNTITNGEVLEIIRKNYNGNIISYIHELEIGAKAFSNENSINKLIKSSTTFWVPSSIVNDFLIDKYKISPDKIFIMPYYIPSNASDFKIESNSENQFVVGGCGTIDWRKGVDLFIVIAIQLFIKYPKASIVFKWAGALPGIELERLNYQVRKCNLEGKVFFEIASSNLNNFYNSIDLFLLPSREDPYPLVILEAANFSVPSICFDSVCGSKDFIINSKGGLVVPFLDINETVEAIINFYNDINFTKKLGENAKDYLKHTHLSDAFVYNKFKELLEN